MPPELTVTVVLRPDDAPDARSAVQGDAVPVQLAVFAKLHRLDDAGTVDSLPLGDFAPRAIRFGDRSAVVEQVRAILVEEADEVAGAISRHGAAPDVAADGVADLALEVDIDGMLAERFGEQYGVTDVRGLDDHDGEGA